MPTSKDNLFGNLPMDCILFFERRVLQISCQWKCDHDFGTTLAAKDLISTVILGWDARVRMTIALESQWLAPWGGVMHSIVEQITSGCVIALSCFWDWHEPRPWSFVRNEPHPLTTVHSRYDKNYDIRSCRRKSSRAYEWAASIHDVTKFRNWSIDLCTHPTDIYAEHQLIIKHIYLYCNLRFRAWIVSGSFYATLIVFAGNWMKIPLPLQQLPVHESTTMCEASL